MASAFSPDTIDVLLAEAKSSGTPIDGTEGLLNQLTKAVLERALAEEMTDHLGYEHGDPAGTARVTPVTVIRTRPCPRPRAR